MGLVVGRMEPRRLLEEQAAEEAKIKDFTHGGVRHMALWDDVDDEFEDDFDTYDDDYDDEDFEGDDFDYDPEFDPSLMLLDEDEDDHNPDFDMPPTPLDDF